MTGGKATPKKDKMLKVSGGQFVKSGTILARGMPTYKAGSNVSGAGVLFARSSGEVNFSKKKTSHGKVRTFINVLPVKEKSKG